MPDELESLGPSQIHLLAWSVADGTATPAEARQLLEEFVRQANAGRVSPRILEHLHDCVSAYLAGRKTLRENREAGRDKPVDVKVPTLDKAFGMIRPQRGQPRVDRDIHCAAAMQVLCELLAGKTFEEAREAVATDRWANGLHVSSETQVGDAWAECKGDALVWLRVVRAHDPDAPVQGWTETEIARLREIYAGVPGVVLPGEKPFEGRHALPVNSATPKNSGNTPP